MKYIKLFFKAIVIAALRAPVGRAGSSFAWLVFGYLKMHSKVRVYVHFRAFPDFPVLTTMVLL